MKITKTDLCVAGACGGGRRWFEENCSTEEQEQGVDGQILFERLASRGLDSNDTQTLKDYAEWLVEHAGISWGVPNIELESAGSRQLTTSLFHPGNMVVQGALTLGIDVYLVIGGDLIIKDGSLFGAAGSHVFVGGDLICKEVVMSNGCVECERLEAEGMVVLDTLHVGRLTCASVAAQELVATRVIDVTKGSLVVESVLWAMADIYIHAGGFSVTMFKNEVAGTKKPKQLITVKGNMTISEEDASTILANTDIEVGGSLEIAGDLVVRELEVGKAITIAGELVEATRVQCKKIKVGAIGICASILCDTITTERITYVRSLSARTLYLRELACLGNKPPRTVKSTLEEGHDMPYETTVKSSLAVLPAVENSTFTVDHKGVRRYL